VHPDTQVLDFMIESPVTVRDDNYWDHLHYRTEVAAKVAAVLARAIQEPDWHDPTFRRLVDRKSARPDQAAR
jgi:hypothetical protein